jgi:hypothetical protein
VSAGPPWQEHPPSQSLTLYNHRTTIVLPKSRIARVGHGSVGTAPSQNCRHPRRRRPSCDQVTGWGPDQCAHTKCEVWCRRPELRGGLSAPFMAAIRRHQR